MNTTIPPLTSPPATEQPPPQAPALSSFRTTEPPEGGWEEGFPRVYYNVHERLAPRVIKTAAEAATLDPTFWMTIPPQEPRAGEEPVYPAIFSSVNLPAVVIHNPAEQEQLGSGWVKLDLETEGLMLAPATPPTPPA